jgi:hypothetical protein
MFLGFLHSYRGHIEGTIGVLILIWVLWPAIRAGFYPEGIEDDD